MRRSETRVAALAARRGIAQSAVVEIAVALLKDLHRVAVQSEAGPVEALHESKWLLDEEGQYHLTGLVVEITRDEAPDLAAGLVQDIFRYVSPERDHWNEELHHWQSEKE